MSTNTESKKESSADIQLTDDERLEVGQLNAEYQEILIELGQLYIRKLQVEEEGDIINSLETEHKKAYAELEKKELDFTSRLNRKYGEGRIDPVGLSYVKN